MATKAILTTFGRQRFFPFRRDGVARDPQMRLTRATMGQVFREATWEEALERALRRLNIDAGFDLAIVDAMPASVPWMAVALPSHWAPEHKVGLGFAQLHAPVADGDRVRQAGEALVRLVAGPERWERFVWTVTDQPRLHAHPRRVATDRWANGLDRAWFRSERQTFIPVAGQRQAIFTIAVDVRPLADVVDTPERAQRLAEALASMSPAVLDYRGLTPVRDALLAWLADR